MKPAALILLALAVFSMNARADGDRIWSALVLATRENPP